MYDIDVNDTVSKILENTSREVQYFSLNEHHHPVDIYLLKVNNRNIRTRYETCSKLTIVDFEHISHIVLLFLLLIAGLTQKLSTLI